MIFVIMEVISRRIIGYIELIIGIVYFWLNRWNYLILGILSLYVVGLIIVGF